MPASYKRFPPPAGHLLIPTRTRRSALAGLSLYSPSKWTGVLIQRAAWFATWLTGPWGLPTKSTSEAPGFVDQDSWKDLQAEWEVRLGRFEDLAIYRPPDSNRVGLAVLLINQGSPSAFVKLRPLEEAELLINEEEALRRMSAFEPSSFAVMEPLASGQVAEWYYLATKPLSGRLHRAPRRPAIESIIDEIQRGLTGMPREPGIAAHWRPTHGDLSPWNLRRQPTGELVLFDWEAAGWGPPGSDLVMYVSAAAAVGLRCDPRLRIDGEALAEAREFWRRHWQVRINSRSIGELNPKGLALQALAALDAAETTDGSDRHPSK